MKIWVKLWLSLVNLKISIIRYYESVNQMLLIEDLPNQTWIKEHVMKIQYASFTLQQRFLSFFYVKSWSNLTAYGSFKICSLWRFWNTPYMLNLMKFWLRYLRLKKVEIFQKLISSSSFSMSIILVNWSINSKIRDIFEICSSWGFQNCHWLLKLMKKWLRYFRLKSRLNFRKVTENMNLPSSVPK